LVIHKKKLYIFPQKIIQDFRSLLKKKRISIEFVMCLCPHICINFFTIDHTFLNSERRSFRSNSTAKNSKIVLGLELAQIKVFFCYIFYISTDLPSPADFFETAQTWLRLLMEAQSINMRKLRHQTLEFPHFYLVFFFFKLQ
jgi:hypothetical protein